jgi:hypothetical protein
LDYPHAVVWCGDCWEQEQHSRQLAELRRANDLKERELDMREHDEWVEPKTAPKPRYVPPMLSPAPKVKGGMSVEPRRRSAS